MFDRDHPSQQQLKFFFQRSVHAENVAYICDISILYMNGSIMGLVQWKWGIRWYVHILPSVFC